MDSHTVFDWESYRLDTYGNVPYPRPSEEELTKIIGDLTVNQRMKYSPPENIVLNECALRGAPDSELQNMSNQTCREYYIVRKTSANKSTCFGFERIPEKLLNGVHTSSIAFDPRNPGIEWSLTLNSDIFANVTEFQLFIGAADQRPYGEMIIPKTYDRGVGKEYNEFGIRYRMVSLIFSDCSLIIVFYLYSSNKGSSNSSIPAMDEL